MCVAHCRQERWMRYAVSARRVMGPLEPVAEGFVDWLAGLGYTSASVADYARRMGWLNDWLVGQGLGVDALTGPVAERFAGEMRAAGHPGATSGRVGRMLAYLREAGVLGSGGESSAVATPEQRLRMAYRAYLAGGRGLAAGTVDTHLRVAGVFLDGLGEAAVRGLVHLTPQQVLEIFRSWGPLARRRSSELRSFLRYLYAAGCTAQNLAMVIPAVRRQAPAHRPVRLQAAEVSAVLRQCGRSSETGYRNYAILVLLSRLALRACEVCRLSLDDIRWRSGTLMIRRKGGRAEEFPLPVDVGQALADYLRARPSARETRAVFLTVLAPRRALTRQGVGGIVRTCCAAAARPAGPHQFRHLTRKSHGVWAGGSVGAAPRRRAVWVLWLPTVGGVRRLGLR